MVDRTLKSNYYYYSYYYYSYSYYYYSYSYSYYYYYYYYYYLSSFYLCQQLFFHFQKQRLNFLFCPQFQMGYLYRPVCDVQFSLILFLTPFT